MLRHKYKILAVGYSLWLTAISLTPRIDVRFFNFKQIDKLVHFFLYFFLVVFWLLACPELKRKKARLLIGAILWGIFIEFMQAYFVPGRSGDWLDALANGIGAFAGLMFYQKLLPKMFR